MSTTSLITGGTSGIGAAFARVLAADGNDLVLVARDEKRLEAVAGELSSRFGVSIETLSADVGSDDGLAAVSARLSDADRPIDLFVNNAGFGLKGRFTEIPAEEHDRMLRVNVRAALLLAHAAASAMSKRGKGDIVNVASVAAFTPGFRSSVTYGASKSFVVAVTESLDGSLSASGVHVSAVCPGWVRSEFHKTAGIDMSNLPSFMWLDADDVAETALKSHRAGKVICIPGLQYKAIVALTFILPRPFVRVIGRTIGRRASHSHRNN